ncbi:unnamed protein product [Mortierella alpina]
MAALKHIHFGSEWLHSQSGKGLIKSLPNMPSFKDRSPDGIIYENDAPIKPQQAVGPEAVPQLKFLPSFAVIQKVIVDLNHVQCTEDHCMVVFTEHGSFTTDAVRMMMRVKNSRDYAERVRGLRSWILAVVAKVDAKFADWFLQELTDKPGLALSSYCTRFQLDGGNSMHVVLSLGSEELLNDEVITAILLFFQRIYGHEGSLFLSPTGLLFGNRWDYGKERVHRSKRLFAVIHMEEHNHWGTACFDLEKRTVAFGDSLEVNKYPVPLEKLRDIVNWLKPLTGPERWDEALANVERFKVPQQQDGVSCGIMATIAIEQAVNEHFSWGEVSPASARIRYLRLLTAFTKMEDDHVVKAYRAHVPDDPFIITPEETMANWLDSMVEDLDEVERGDRIKSGPKTPGWTVLQDDPPEVKYDDEWLMEPLDLSHLKQLKDRKFGRIVKGGLKKEMVEKISRDHEAEDAPIKIHVLCSDSDSDASVQRAPRDPKIDDDGSSDDYSSSDDKKKRDGYHATPSKATLKNLDLDWPSDDEDEVINITQESDMVVKEEVEGLPPAPAIQDEFPDLEAAMSSIKAYARHVGFGVSTGRSQLTKRNRNGSMQTVGSPATSQKEQEVNPRTRSGSKKCGCKYRIKLSSPVAISPAWHIINIAAEHNHPMDEETVRTSPLTQEMKDLILKAVKMNFITRDIRSWLSQEFPGTVLDIHQFNNFLAHCRKDAKATPLNEATQLTIYLSKLYASKKAPHRLFFRHAVDQQDRLRGLFWMTVEQRVLYNWYCDMVIHDTTASTN